MSPKLVRYGHGEVEPESQIETPRGDWVTVVDFRAPTDDEDPGVVRIRLPWGPTEEVDPIKVGCYISLD